MSILRYIRSRGWDVWIRPHKIPSEIRKLRAENKALVSWIHARHIPSVRSVPSGTVKALTRISVFMLLTCSASAQKILTTFYTTNTTPIVTAFVSAGGTNSRQFGTTSLTNLSGNPNVATNILGAGTVTVTSNNAGAWTITGAAGTPGLTTNDNQFLGTPLSIKAGAFTTNFNSWLPGTNHSNFRVEGDLVVTAGDTFTENIFPSLDDNYLLGSASSAWNSIFAKSGGLNLVESIGSDAISILAPALGSSYSLTLPNAQGAGGTTITNNGSGALGWWDTTAVIAQKQFGSANLTNWSNIPTGSMANAVSTTFLTNWANAISNYVTASTNSASVTNWINSRQPASANLTNWSLIPTGEMANVVSATFLTNWANAISNFVTSSTNSASVTNWINGRQPASANLTNWSNIPTGAMANVVSTDFLTNWANAISNLTQIKTALTTNANQFGASVQLTIKDGVLLTNSTLRGTTTVLGPQTNSDMVNIAGGVTNWIQAEVKGTLFASSNLIGKAGQSTSNFWPEGVFFRDASTYWTNLNGTIGTFTNLGNGSIPAHMLTNANDTVYGFWEGVTGTALQTTNNLRLVYGSDVAIDTGVQTSSNIIFRAWITISRVNGTAEQVNSQFEWVPNLLGVTGVPWTTTNRNFRAVQTNGIATSLALQGASRRGGGITNTFVEFKFSPGPR